MPVYPPARFMEPCEREPVAPIEEALSVLSEIVDCERGDKAALRAWVAERRSEHSDGQGDDHEQDRGPDH